MTAEDDLRKAAEAVRDQALHASPGPWAASNPRGARQWEVGQPGHAPLAQVPPHDNVREPANAEWIALVNPAVAEPLAALLDAAKQSNDAVVRQHAVSVAQTLVASAAD